MEEVIARRKNSLGVGYISAAVIGFALCAFGVGIGIAQDLIGAIVIGLAVGLLIAAVGVWQAVIFYKSPKNIITYRDGILQLGNKAACSPLDVSGCKIIVTRRNGVVDRWGKVEITLTDGRKFVLNYVDYVEAVQQRLGSLKAECYDNLMKQRAAEEAAAAKHADTEAAQKTENPNDPFGV
ncbi:MAG: hypothetical protein K2L42_01325 [Clostridia bacterium]|nr:hypothetical protein [Clostridia bacterium]